MGLFSRTTWVSQYQTGKTSLDLNKARDDGVWGCSGIICKQSAPRSRQITTTTPHHSFFTGWMLFLTPNQQCQGTEGRPQHQKDNSVRAWLVGHMQNASLKCNVNQCDSWANRVSLKLWSREVKWSQLHQRPSLNAVWKSMLWIMQTSQHSNTLHYRLLYQFSLRSVAP